MTDSKDSNTENPIAGDTASLQPDEYRLTDVLRGRMFCITHGRACYQRSSVLADDEWICPDERHRNPIRNSLVKS